MLPLAGIWVDGETLADVGGSVCPLPDCERGRFVNYVRLPMKRCSPTKFSIMQNAAWMHKCERKMHVGCFARNPTAV